MLNKIVIVGRLNDKPILEETEQGNSVSTITLVVPRTFKNEEGVYDNDYINVTLLGSIAENTKEYCEKGDLISIKGRVARKDTMSSMEIIADKVTFLSSKKVEDE